MLAAQGEHTATPNERVGLWGRAVPPQLLFTVLSGCTVLWCWLGSGLSVVLAMHGPAVGVQSALWDAVCLRTAAVCRLTCAVQKEAHGLPPYPKVFLHCSWDSGAFCLWLLVLPLALGRSSVTPTASHRSAHGGTGSGVGPTAPRRGAAGAQRDCSTAPPRNSRSAPTAPHTHRDAAHSPGLCHSGVTACRDGEILPWGTEALRCGAVALRCGAVSR